MTLYFSESTLYIYKYMFFTCFQITLSYGPLKLRFFPSGKMEVMNNVYLAGYRLKLKNNPPEAHLYR